MTTEPVRLVALLNTALMATLAVVVIVAHLSSELAGGLGLALSAWVALAGEWVRSKVSPTPPAAP